MKNFKIILIACLLSTLFSCEVMKELDRTDNSELETYKEQIKINRPGTTTTIEVPNITYKDTTITRVNTVDKTVLRVNYDTQGNKTIDCETADYIEERNIEHTKQINDIIETLKSEKTFNPQNLFYAMGAFLVIVIIGLVIMQRSIINIQKNIPGLITKAISEMNK